MGVSWYRPGMFIRKKPNKSGTISVQIIKKVGRSNRLSISRDPNLCYGYVCSLLRLFLIFTVALSALVDVLIKALMAIIAPGIYKKFLSKHCSTALNVDS